MESVGADMFRLDVDYIDHRDNFLFQLIVENNMFTVKKHENTLLEKMKMLLKH